MIRLISALSALVAVPSFAFAALPTGVDTAISGAGTDAATALGLMIVVAVSIWALRKVVGLFSR